MHVLIAIAFKSLLIAGATLGLLELVKHRSAAERSWVAHIGLFALVILALAPLVLPSWNIEAPALLGSSPEAMATVAQPAQAAVAASTPAATTPVVPAAAPARASLNPIAAVTAAYAVPAAILLFITFLALARLVTLRARAEVLVDGHWLSALARAQRRMGFKHGTALLTSDDLASPISWGLMRPVILLNTRAVEASGEAEAILAHELAHVARMDWAKLLLARVATALFWFNPLVWVLAREAHQLREETADDAVLAADIVDTDYAQLLVGVARHECPGLLLGAHGVAPSKSSLARRVARVLDGKQVRGPVARSFAVGVLVGAMLVAAPLAALTLTPATPKAARTASSTASASSAAVDDAKPYYSASDVPTDLPRIIAQGVSAAVSAAVVPDAAEEARQEALEAAAGARRDALQAAAEARQDAIEAARDAVEQARDSAAERRLGKKVMVTVDLDRRGRPKSALDRASELKALGVTPEYVAAMRSVAPQIGLSHDDLVELAGVGVTPQFVQELANAGYRGIPARQITEAYAVGVRPDYIRAMAATGYPRIPLPKLTEMRAVGITPADVQRFRRAGFTNLSVNDLMQAKALGISPEELRASERYGP